MRHINAAGLAIIKEFEGCKLTAYRDVGGRMTIGIGHLDDNLKEGETITPDRAEELLRDDLHKMEAALCKFLPLSLTENQFSALVCFAYNCGPEALRTSTLLRLVAHGDYQKAGDEFLRWDKVQGKMVPGLLRRRKAERDLFLTPVSQVG